ncbi:RNA-protein complex protein Nop10 [Haloquadratum walsbyi]|jgi:H/ACA ribonucleoprotein complex subunit 3|uniref:Ribosome biogenesis protein Nop10 n=1 Tax=Haloquadratum walsbyi (strain DSM 16854 / JCM 12705 / C23) TaxID=768065 RepID=G0LHK8_HALWC|nr:RNA-protein complex protein Nop10 [Haloquadratum walsbyi]CCC39246.1 tRNA/rRNA pseudouridine synthase complex protein Nop10 [Haloquadratum walsbyi C23]
MKSNIKICASWQENHEQPVYTLADTCPKCNSVTKNTAPAPFDPTDAYGEYRRALKQRVRE